MLELFKLVLDEDELYTPLVYSDDEHRKRKRRQSSSLGEMVEKRKE